MSHPFWLVSGELFRLGWCVFDRAFALGAALERARWQLTVRVQRT